MKFLLTVLIGFIGGFILGIALSEIIGIFGMVIFNTAMGIKYLPFYTAMLCAIVLPIIKLKKRK